MHNDINLILIIWNLFMHEMKFRVDYYNIKMQANVKELELCQGESCLDI